MTTKSEYSEQEWESLLQTPVLAGSYIIVADISVTAVPRELKGLYKAIVAQDAPTASQELVAAVVADLLQRAENKEKLEQIPYKESKDPRPQMLESLRQSLSILAEKGSPGEKDGFCTWLLNVAEATAEAGREGGFLGIGSVRVSEQEQAALDELKHAFGLA